MKDKEKSQSRLAPIDEDRRLIEHIAPFSEIDAEGAKERSIRQGHISTIHIWWSRKPTTTSRYGIIASLIKMHKINKNANSLKKDLIDICKWNNTNDKRAEETPWLFFKLKKLLFF